MLDKLTFANVLLIERSPGHHCVSCHSIGVNLIVIKVNTDTEGHDFADSSSVYNMKTMTNYL